MTTPASSDNKPTVKLTGKNGNAFAIIGEVSRALRNAGYTKEQIADYRAQAMAGDYNNLLVVSMEWANVT